MMIFKDSFRKIRKHKRARILIAFLFLNSSLIAQKPAAYWVTFNDKNNSPYSIKNPSQFLSQRAIDRRLKNKINISTDDIPVNKTYTDSLALPGVKVMYTSKWFNAATIEVSDENIIPVIENYTFVRSVTRTRDASLLKGATHDRKNDVIFSDESVNYSDENYGAGFTQINQLNGQFLHNKGFKGKNVRIAIIDAGFKQANVYESLTRTWSEKRILGTRDFVTPGNNVFAEHMHGASVLSTIASNENGKLIGTAPEASFWLLRTEDTDCEYPIEGDNWVAAAEFADSAGADVTTTSLGYNQFNNTLYNYTYSNLNGIIARISVAASIAASKGIIVLNSAGNDGNDAWHYINVPADAKDILSVGAIDANKQRAGFSSFGPSSDGRVKPDIVAMGQSITAETSPGVYSKISGTSFSCPIAAGTVACLVQAFPNATAKQIKEAILESASQYSQPDSSLGYGIPNFETAYNILKENKSIIDEQQYAFPNPFITNLTLKTSLNSDNEILVKCYNITGKEIFTKKTTGNYIELTSDIIHLPQGMYLFKCSDKNESVTIKAFKLNEKQ